MDEFAFDEGADMAPYIETERLILREMRRDDFAAFAAIWREPEVVRFIGAEARSEAESWSAFLKNAGSWAIERFGQWAIVRKSDGVFCGQAGFFRAMRGLGADFDAAPEAGWVLGAEFHGQGYGREAVTAAHMWFDAQPFGGKSHAIIEAGHAVSFGLAMRLGYRAMREADFGGARVTLLVRSPDEGG